MTKSQSHQQSQVCCLSLTWVRGVSGNSLRLWTGHFIPLLSMNPIFLSILCLSLCHCPQIPSTPSILFTSYYRHEPPSKLCSLKRLTSKHSQHLFQIRSSKHILQLGGESLWLLQGPGLTPREKRHYETPALLNLGASNSCIPGPLVNFNILCWRKLASFCKELWHRSQKTWTKN